MQFQDLREKLGHSAFATSEAFPSQGPACPETDVGVDEKLHADAEKLLQVWLRGECVKNFLGSLPQYMPNASMENAISKFRSAANTLLQDSISSLAAMQTSPLVGETTCYPFSVMVMAASIASATPMALLLDTVLAVLHSLVHKHFHLNLGRWENRSRYWFVGSADTGEGKRGAMKPVIQAAQKVLRNSAGLMVGNPADDFHMQQSCTSAAAIDKLRSTDGYLLLHSDEAGQCLDLTFSGTSAGGTRKSEHVDLTMFLDAAHGDEFSHTTMLDRKKACKREPTHRSDPVCEPTPLTVATNMQVCWLQQELYFLQYWALAAHTKPIGLVQRCLFSFGRALPAPDPAMNTFWKDIFLPFLESIFSTTLTTFGPKASEVAEQPLSMTRSQEQLLFQLEELLKVFSSRRRLNAVAKGAMPKCLYWLGTCIRTNFLLEHCMGAYIQGLRSPPGLSLVVQDANVLSALNFLTQRYLFGIMVVATSVAERSWCTISEQPKHVIDNITEYILQVLRAIPFPSISRKDIFHACLELAWLAKRGDHSDQLRAQDCLTKIFEGLQDLARNLDMFSFLPRIP